MIILLLLGKIARTNLIKTLYLLTKIVQIRANIFFKLHIFCTVSFKFVLAILPKSRRTIIDYQLNSLLENCLKPQLVGFGLADVLGLVDLKMQ